MAGRGQTFLGLPTYEEAKHRTLCFRMPPCPAKNVDEPLPIFSVRGIVPPPEKGEADDAQSWKLQDLLLCMHCSIEQASGAVITGIVTGILPMSGGGSRIEM